MKGLLMYVCVCVTKGLLCLNIFINFISRSLMV